MSNKDRAATPDARYWFRMSERWKAFKLKKKKHDEFIDKITKQPLQWSWSLHHLDMRVSHYKDISDMDRFMCLNHDTHQFIHWLYRLWCKDSNIIERIEKLMMRMYECSHDKCKKH